MSDAYRAALHNAPPTLSALAVSDRPAFERECWARHEAARERWIAANRPPVVNRLLARIIGR